MSPARRAFLGALAGALVVLLAHPAARPFVNGFAKIGGSAFLDQTTSLPTNLESLPEPSTDQSAALLLVVASDKEYAGENLSGDNYRLLADVAQRWSVQDPDNAFWKQMLAVYEARLGRMAESKRAWQSASVATRWNDYQSGRLSEVLAGLERESGRSMAWHYAVVYRARSIAPAALISAHAETMLQSAEPEGLLDLRYRTLVNGHLLRDGARSIAGSQFGARMMETAVLAGPIAGSSPRALQRAWGALIQEIRDAGFDQEADAVLNALATNEAWRAFVNPAESRRHHTNLSLAAIACATLPGALFIVGLIGLAVRGLGWLLIRFPALQALLKLPASPILGVCAGVVVYAIARLIFPAVWAAVALASFAVVPDRVRSTQPSFLGSAFAVTVGALSGVVAILLCLFFVGVGSAYIHLADLAPIATAYGTGSTLVLGLAGILFSLVLVMGPVWAYMHRLHASEVAALALCNFGRIVGIGCLTACVLLAPVAIVGDRAVGASLQQLFENEPAYYLK